MGRPRSPAMAGRDTRDPLENSGSDQKETRMDAFRQQESAMKRLKERYLAIETSSPRLSLAVGNEESVLAAYQGRHDWRHAENIFRTTEKILTRVGWPIKTLTGVAVSVGPGSFTGIRIGLAAARALGQALRIPVTGTSSLEIMAGA